MLNEISCWAWDWGAISAVGTWVGGLGTVAAASWGVFSLNDAWKKERERNAKRSQTLLILISAEISSAAGVVQQVVERPGLLGNPEAVSDFRENLLLTYVQELLSLSGELDRDLAFTLAQVHHYVTVLDKYLERWSKGARSGDIAEMIDQVAQALGLSIEKLKAEMDKAPILNPHLKVGIEWSKSSRQGGGKTLGGWPL